MILSAYLKGEGNFKIEEFIAELQGFSLGLRLDHWQTKSYANHKAVELTQETLDGLIDDFVEAYVGMLGGSRPEFTREIKASTEVDATITCLKNLAVNDTSLLNIRDEMLHALYKLKYLKTLS